MIDSNEINLHDAVLKKMEIDIINKTVVLSIDYYESADAVGRTELSLLFCGVSSVSNITDVNMLEDNVRAGNVSNWHPAGGDVPTYIYLVGGCISITAKSTRLVN